MPVTARLSKAFYDRFGEEIVTELVEWFNLVDSTYRSELRETNELNFARFDAKLEQRLSQLEAKLEQRMSQLELRMSQLEAKLDAKLDLRISQVEARVDVKLAQLESRLTGVMERGFSKQTRFLYVSLVAQIALILAALSR